jgi:hypothetical protein
MGGLAAAVTLRKEPPLKEKAAWIVLIALVMVAEIQNLYVADKQQNAVFSSIKGGLENTTNGLDQTALGLRNATNALSGVSDGINKTFGENQKQFEAASERSKEILNKTKSAANMAAESVSDLTGGDSVPEIFAVKNIARGNPPQFLLAFKVDGNHALRNVSVSYQDMNYNQTIQGRPMTLDQAKALSHFVPLDDGGTGTILPGGNFLNTYIPAGRYAFRIATASGMFGEDMTLTITAPGVLSEVYTVKKAGKVLVQMDDRGYVVKPPGESQ